MRRKIWAFLALSLLIFPARAWGQNPGGITTAPIWQLKADAITSTEGTAISSWTASFGPSPTQPSSALYPVYHAGSSPAGPNSKPYVTFTNAQALYTSSLTSSSGPYSMFFVQRIPNTTASHWTLDSASGRLVCYTWDTITSAKIGFFDGAFETVDSTAADVQATSWIVIEWRFDSAGSLGTIYVNGTSVGTHAYTAKPLGGVTAIGNAEDDAQGSGSPAGGGDIAEAIVFNSLLSSGDRNAVGNYLATKYGVTTAYTGASASFTVSPTSLTAGTTGNTVTLTGSNTSWTSGTTFSVSGGTGASITNKVYNSATSVTLTVTAGSAAGTLTYSDTTDSATATQTVTALNVISMSNAAILYSPYNWYVASGVAQTINSGAYLRTIVGSTVNVSLQTNTANNSAPYSQFWARFDNDAWTQYSLSSGNPTISLSTSLNSAKKHTLELVVKSTSETISRWASNSATMLTFTGIVLDTGGTVTTPTRKSKNVLIYGDSITEGVRVRGFTGIANDTDRNDVLGDYSWASLYSLDCEFGIVGFGGTGVTVAGSGSVPALSSSYNYLFSGQARTFSPAPDVVAVNEGANENGTSVTSGLSTVIGSIQSAAPNAKFLLMRPFGGQNAANVLAAVSGVGFSNVQYVDTTGWFNTADSSDSLHPYDYEHLGFIAPKFTPVIASALYGAYTGPTTAQIAAAILATPANLLQTDASGYAKSNLQTIAGQTATASGAVTFPTGTLSTYAGGAVSSVTGNVGGITGVTFPATVPSSAQISALLPSTYSLAANDETALTRLYAAFGGAGGSNTTPVYASTVLANAPDPFANPFSPTSAYGNTAWGYWLQNTLPANTATAVFNTTVMPGTTAKLALALSTVGACTYTLGTLNTTAHSQPVYYYPPGTTQAAINAGTATIISTATIYYQSDNKTTITVVRTPGTF